MRLSLGRQRGAALLLMMFLLVLAGILLSVVGEVVHTALRRDKEAQLLFAGEEYRKAIAAYFAASPPEAGAYPEKLEQLLLDNRQLVPVRHLRRLYRDPLTDSLEWGLVKSGGRIVGVYSRGEGKPIKQADFGPGREGFEKAKTYADWKFTAGGTAEAATAAGRGRAPGTAAPHKAGDAAVR